MKQFIYKGRYERALGEVLPKRNISTNTQKKKVRPNVDTYAFKWQTLLSDWLETWKEVPRQNSFFTDILAGLTVAAVALPLNIALAVASGLPPSSGLFAGIIGGGLAIILGGASLQVTGPAAALNLMVFALVAEFGGAGASAAALVVGAVQLVLMLCFAGSLIKYVPHAILGGLMTGVGLKLLDSQIPEILGFDGKMEITKMLLHPSWLHDVSWSAVVCGLLVAFMTIIFKPYKRFPASLVGVGIVTFLAVYLNWDLKKVGAITASVPVLDFPDLTTTQWGQLIVKAIPLALLATVESLLAAQIIDHMSKAKKPHNSNLELFAQGFANIMSGLFRGMPVTGVVVRSTVNVQSGAKTKVAALTHSVILFFCIFYLAHAIEVIPLAALAGLLCVIGFRLVEISTFTHLLKTSKLQAAAFVAMTIGTLTNYMMTGLLVGGALALTDYFFFKRNKKVPTKELAPQVTLAKKVEGSESINWLKQIKAKAHISSTAFVHSQASVIGKVILANNVHIAAGSSVRADEGTPFYIGESTNIQDGVVIHALKEKWISVDGEDWAVYIGKNVSLAHQALVHGPCFIGDHSFVGFKAVVHDSMVGQNCYIGIGAVVVGVEVPDGRYVPNGMVVDSADKVDQLPLVTRSHQHFNEDVVEVNRGLAKAYLNHFGEEEKNDVQNIAHQKIPLTRTSNIEVF